MKFISTIFLFLIYIQTAKSQASLHLKINNLPGETDVTLSICEDPFFVDPCKDIIGKTDKKGYLTLSFPIKRAVPAKLIIGDEFTMLYLVPYDSLVVSADFADFDHTIHYTGKGAADNNFMAAEQLHEFEQRANTYSSYSDAHAFAQHMDSLENELNTFYTSYSKEEFTKEFSRYLKNKVKYRFYSARWMFKLSFDHATSTFNYKEVPADYFNYLRVINLNDQDAAENEYYRSAILRYFDEYNDTIYKKNIKDTLHAGMSITTEFGIQYNLYKKLFTGAVLNYQLTLLLLEQLSSITENEYYVNKILADYRTTCTNKEYKNKVQKTYLKLTELTKGKKMPDFYFTDIKGNKIGISNFKGKKVYIDLWATWCVPCRAEMPHTQKFIEENKNLKSTAFVFINFNDNKASWLNYDGIKLGENMFADDEQTEKITSLFGINGIPRHMIVDVKGNIISIEYEGALDELKKILSQ